MDSNVLVQGIIISCVYVFFRFIEMRFVIKKHIPIKQLLRDTLLVYVSFISGAFVYRQLEPIKNLTKTPLVFTNPADF